MRLWLFRRSRGAAGTGADFAVHDHMTIGSLEHAVRNRVRLFLRHTWLVAILGTVALAACLWAGFRFSTEADGMRIAAAPQDRKFVQALSAQIAKGRHNLSLQTVPTQNGKDTAEAMNKGAADLAILPSPLDDSLNWPVIAILRQNVMALIVPPAGAGPASGAGATTAKPIKPAKSSKSGGGKSAAGAKAKADKKAKKTKKVAQSDDDDSDAGDNSGSFSKVAELSGKRVGIVTGNEATAGLLNLVLKHYGVPSANVTVSTIAPGGIAEAVRNNQIDVLFVAGAATGQAISYAVTAATVNGKAPTFIEIDQADGIAKRHPAFDSVDIDAGTFGGNPPVPDDSLKSLSFGEYLVARKSYNDSVIARLAKVLYSSRQALADALPGDIKIAAPSTDKDADIVAHPGALAFLSDSQQSFFDKYGDDIFYGMLIFPVFGSAIAGLATYLRRDNRTRRLRLLQRVLDLVRKAHVAQTLDALDHLQIEADNLVVAIIHQGEHEEFDESVRMSFAFALDQLRFAIAERRTAIAAGQAGIAAPAAGGSKAAAA